MTFTNFSLAVLLLLVTPGPTNTLMVLAGYQRGIARALPLIAAEIFGYLTVIIPVASLAAPLFQEWPLLGQGLKLVAGCWVLFLALRLWQADPQARQQRPVGARGVFITTCLNPKALIIALVLLPHGNVLTLAPWLFLFSGLVVLAAGCWIAVGHRIARTDKPFLKPRVIHRAAAAGLLVFAVVLTGTSLSAMG